MAGPVVALVLVSHSRLLAQGLADVAGQMAPDVLLVPVGGTEDGRIGTDFDLVSQALEKALGEGRSAVVLTDLGSAALTTDSVLELADADTVARVRVADAPFVEGAVEAAVTAQGGADLAAVHEAAERAGSGFAGAAGSGTGSGTGSDTGSGKGGASGAGAGGAGVGVGAQAGDATGTRTPTAAEGGTTVGERGPDGDEGAGTDASGPGRPGSGAAAGDAGRAGTSTARATAVLRNRLGLHARPAAQVVRTATAFDAVITINGADARSILALVSLNAVGGQEVVVAASGPQARTAVNALIDELENGFGEA